MGQITVLNLGVAALQIEAGDRRILIDAFNTLIRPVEVRAGDILIFTHDDGDHFSPDRMPSVKGRNITVIGPPSIVKPILDLNRADINQIVTLYTNIFAEPSGISIKDVNITCYHTNHFNHWDPIHNSYLIEILDKRLYITGDSLLTKEQAEITSGTDAVICNLVDEDFLKAKEKANVAIHHTLSYLLKVRTMGMTKLVIGVHLLDFNRAVNADDIEKLVKEYGFDNIIIPVSSKQRILI